MQNIEKWASEELIPGVNIPVPESYERGQYGAASTHFRRETNGKVEFYTTIPTVREPLEESLKEACINKTLPRRSYTNVEHAPDGKLSDQFLDELLTMKPCNLDINPSKPSVMERRQMNIPYSKCRDFLPRLPRTGLESNDLLNHDVFRDLGKEAPWQPLPIFDRRLIEAHVSHAENCYEGGVLGHYFGPGKDLLTPEDIGGPMETDWKYQEMAGQEKPSLYRLQPKFKEAIDKYMGAPTPTSSAASSGQLQEFEMSARSREQPPAGSVPKQSALRLDDALDLTRRPSDKNADVNALLLESPLSLGVSQRLEQFQARITSSKAKEDDEDAARARMRDLLRNATAQGYDTSLPEHEKMPTSNPVAAIFAPTSAPIGFVSRDEMQHHVDTRYNECIDAYAAAGLLCPLGTAKVEGSDSRDRLVANHKIVPTPSKRVTSKSKPITPPTTPPKPAKCRSSTRKRKLPATFEDSDAVSESSKESSPKKRKLPTMAPAQQVLEAEGQQVSPPERRMSLKAPTPEPLSPVLAPREPAPSEPGLSFLRADSVLQSTENHLSTKEELPKTCEVSIEAPEHVEGRSSRTRKLPARFMA